MPAYSHIMLATKFSPACEEAAQRAVELARLFNARLTLLHVIEHFPEDLPVDDICPECSDPEAALAERARDRLDDLARRLDVPEAARVVRVSNFSARHEVAEQVREGKVDLLVLGSPVHPGLLGHIGSTASSLASVASCEVLLVRPRAAA